MMMMEGSRERRRSVAPGAAAAAAMDDHAAAPPRLPMLMRRLQWMRMALHLRGPPARASSHHLHHYHHCYPPVAALASPRCPVQYTQQSRPAPSTNRHTERTMLPP